MGRDNKEKIKLYKKIVQNLRNTKLTKKTNKNILIL